MTAARGKIISVEDSDTDFMSLRFALKSSGVNADIERYESGGEALHEFGATCPLASKATLVLLDLNLPGCDGRQVLKAVRDHDPERKVPVIVLSTSSHPRDIDFCYRAGADAYVVKPFELDDWERKIGPLAEYWLRTAAQRTQPAGSRKAKVAPRMRERDMTSHVAQLMRAIEGEIIPRLLLAHGGASAAPNNARTAKGSASDEVTELARLALSHDVAAATKLIERLQTTGVSLEMLYRTHVAPAARLVGDIWKAEMCSFSDFERAFVCLQDLLVQVNPAERPDETMH
jgi:CheY-like chemotaxis protein